MSHSFDKSQLMAYVHGEMSDAEARAFTQALSQDESLRLEVEELLHTSHAVSSYFAAGTNEGLDAKQLAMIRKKAAGPAPKFSPWWYLAGGFVAASIAAVVTVRVLDTTPHEAETLANIEETLPTPLEEDQAMVNEVADADTATAEKELAEEKSANDELATEEDVAKMAAMEPAPESFGSAGSAHSGAGHLGGLAMQKRGSAEGASAKMEAADPSKVGMLGAHDGKGMQKQKENFSEDTELAQDVAAPSVSESVPAASPAKKAMQAPMAAKVLRAEIVSHGLRVNKTKSTISPNLSKDAVFEYLKQNLESGESCIPTSVKAKSMALIFEINREGRFASVKTEPSLSQSAEIADCIKEKLKDSKQVLTPSDKGPARVKIQIELQ